LLVAPIDLAELSLKITLLAKDHAEMEDQQRRHHQENNPIRGEHDTEAEQREAAALMGWDVPSTSSTTPTTMRGSIGSLARIPSGTN
jgi:hypothetical protein